MTMTRARILVVDDDEAVLDYLKAKIGARYDLIATTVSREVMQLARERQPKLILCDLDMPGLDGSDVSAALFADEELRHIPLIFLTGLAMPEEIKSLEGRIGGRPAVSKRARLGELLERIEKVMQS